jgi:hypothetical protein
MYTLKLNTMRSATVTCLLFVAFGYAASAQFTIQPQVGIENFRTSLNYNNLPSFSPLGGKLSPQASVRLDYKFKHGHGPFLGIATSNSVVSFNFSDPETARNVYQASAGDIQLRFEAGYQLTSKRIYFNKSGATSKPASKSVSKSSQNETNYTKHGCGEYSERSRCCSHSSTTKSKIAASKNNGWWMRIQPSIGAAFIPSVKQDLITNPQGSQASYEYRAGNWNSALVTGTSFEFGNNAQRKFTVSINYLKGLGNLDTRMLTTTTGAKTVTTDFKSAVSGWNLKLGVPISLSKTKTIAKQKVIEKTYKYKYEGKCGQYRSRCGRVIKM